MKNLEQSFSNNEFLRLSVSMEEAAKMLGLSERKIFSLVKSGEIKHKHAGRRVLISVKELERWLEKD